MTAARSFCGGVAMRYVLPVLRMTSWLWCKRCERCKLKVTHQGQNWGRSLMSTIALLCLALR